MLGLLDNISLHVRRYWPFSSVYFYPLFIFIDFTAFVLQITINPRKSIILSLNNAVYVAK